MSGLTKFLLDEVEMPLVEVTAAVEEAGYPIDKDYFCDLRSRLEAERRELTRTMRAGDAGPDFDPASRDQVAELLYQKLGLPVSRRTDTGRPSVDKQALEPLKDSHAVVPLLRKHRKVTKIIGTYCTIPDQVDADGRLRVEFEQMGAETGRFTSPSVIQTIPGDDDYGLRRGFAAGAGLRIVGADFKQQELVVLAQVSGDENLRAAVRRGTDLHGLAAVKVFGLDCDPNEVKVKYPDQRDRVKAIQFGIIYGQSQWALAADLGIAEDDARKLLDDYFAQFPAVKRFIDDVHARVARDGYVDDLFGRRRHFPDAKLQRPRKKYERMSAAEKDLVRKVSAARRQAQNFVVQGASATITKLAMLRCHRHIQAERPGVKMILTLHDELQFEVPEAEVDPFAAELPALMCELGLERFGFAVPLAVEIKEGPSWGDLTAFHAREG